MTAPTQQKRTMAVLLSLALVTGFVPAIPSVAFADDQATARAGLEDASSVETDDGIEPLANVAVSGTKITVPSYVRKPSNATRAGIDVSEHNGKINWDTLKAAGVQFAIIRCGYGQDYSSQHDDRWIENVKGAARVGIPYGVYIYSYADSVAKAKGEADHIIRLLNESKCKPTYPIYYDLEESSLASWVNVPLLAEMSFAFCSKVSAPAIRLPCTPTPTGSPTISPTRCSALGGAGWPSTIPGARTRGRTKCGSAPPTATRPGSLAIGAAWM